MLTPQQGSPIAAGTNPVFIRDSLIPQGWSLHGEVLKPMTDPPTKAADRTTEEGEAHNLGLVRELMMLLRAILASPVGKTLVLLAIAVVLVIVATAYGQIRLNRWNQPFYDALSRRDLRSFLFQLGVFFLIAGFLLVLNVAQRWLVETLAVKLREGLVTILLQIGCSPVKRSGSPFRTIGINPDQRMHEDARHLTTLSADLGNGVLQASILLHFASVLGRFPATSFPYGGLGLYHTGFMLWAAILYAGPARC